VLYVHFLDLRVGDLDLEARDLDLRTRNLDNLDLSSEAYWGHQIHMN